MTNPDVGAFTPAQLDEARHKQYLEDTRYATDE